MCHPCRLFCHPRCGCGPSVRVHQPIDAGGDAGDLRDHEATQLHELGQASLHGAFGAADVLGEGGHGRPGVALTVGVGGDGNGYRSLVLPKVFCGEQGSLDGLTHGLHISVRQGPGRLSWRPGPISGLKPPAPPVQRCDTWANSVAAGFFTDAREAVDDRRESRVLAAAGAGMPGYPRMAVKAVLRSLAAGIHGGSLRAKARTGHRLRLFVSRPLSGGGVMVRTAADGSATGGPDRRSIRRRGQATPPGTAGGRHWHRRSDAERHDPGGSRQLSALLHRAAALRLNSPHRTSPQVTAHVPAVPPRPRPASQASTAWTGCPTGDSRLHRTTLTRSPTTCSAPGRPREPTNPRRGPCRLRLPKRAAVPASAVARAGVTVRGCSTEGDDQSERIAPTRHSAC